MCEVRYDVLCWMHGRVTSVRLTAHCPQYFGVVIMLSAAYPFRVGSLRSSWQAAYAKVHLRVLKYVYTGGCPRDMSGCPTEWVQTQVGSRFV